MSTSGRLGRNPFEKKPSEPAKKPQAAKKTPGTALPELFSALIAQTVLIGIKAWGAKGWVFARMRSAKP